MEPSLFKSIFILSAILAISAGVAHAEVQACKVGDLTQGNWERMGTFNPVLMDSNAPPQSWFDPLQLGMYRIGQTVAYHMTIPGYGTQYIDRYALQADGTSPSVYTDFIFDTANSGGLAYYDASLVNDPRTFFRDPIVGLFTVRAFGGTQQRGATYFKYYCSYIGLVVWKWKCNRQPQQFFVKQSNLGVACPQGTCCN